MGNGNIHLHKELYKGIVLVYTTNLRMYKSIEKNTIEKRGHFIGIKQIHIYVINGYI